MDIVPIHPNDLRSVWDKVKDGLAKMPADDWIPEDVYHAVKSGESALYIGANESGYAGFMVLRRLVAEFSREARLHVWLVYNHGEPSVMDHGLQVIRKAATQAGCKKITFGSPRLGWSKRYPVSNVNYEIPQ